MILLDAKLKSLMGTTGGVPSALQLALQLELTTIPPYLYALYSIRPGTNPAIESRLKSIVIEEMLHMTLVCNLLNAIGGSPVLNTATVVPTYPGPLPGSVAGGLIVPLRPFSKDLVRTVFMVIEEPEMPIPVSAATAIPEVAMTIGQFYAGIKETLRKQTFAADPARQVRPADVFGFFPDDELIPVTDFASASAAIDVIVEQGEGTTKSVNDQDGDLAHFYAFLEILNDKTLGQNPLAQPDDPLDRQFIFTGDLPPFDPTGVRPLLENPRAAQYPAGSAAAVANDDFNKTYTGLLLSLHAAFNGAPAEIGGTLGKMNGLRQQALTVMDIALPDGTHAGPSFEFVAH